MQPEVIYNPKSLSYSALRLYDTCPKCYYWQYVVGIKKIDDAHALHFGSEFHAGLANKYLNGEFIVSANEYVTNEDVEKMHKMHQAFVDAGRIYKPYKVEYGFTAPLVNPITQKAIKIPFRGFIDLITTDGLIIDHKTSSKNYDPETSKTEMQLMIYSMIYRQLFGKAPTALIYSVFRKNLKTAKWQEVIVEPDEVNEAIAWKEIYWTVRKIQLANFDRAETKVWYKHHQLCKA